MAIRDPIKRAQARHRFIAALEHCTADEFTLIADTLSENAYRCETVGERRRAEQLLLSDNTRAVLEALSDYFRA